MNEVRSSSREPKSRRDTSTSAASAANEGMDFKADLARIRKEVKSNRNNRVQVGMLAYLALKTYDLRVPTDLIVLALTSLFQEPYTNDQMQSKVEALLIFFTHKLIETRTVEVNGREVRYPRRDDFHPHDRAALRALAKKRGYLHLQETLAIPN